MKVSVIIPIYNVEAFIARCVESLMVQTLNDVEYIFVNDATKDNSMTILRSIIMKYPQRENQIKLLNHSRNLGLPAARNTGLRAASGEYIFHCDSDDFVESNMLENMYNTAVLRNADIIWCDWYLSFGKNERYMKQPSYDSPKNALKGMLGGAMKFNVWNKLVKHSLYVDNNIKFPEGYGMGEDMTMMLLFACAKKVTYLPGAFYHYVKLNAEAFTQTYSERHFLSLKYNVECVENFIRAKFADELDMELAYLKLEVKFPFLIMDVDKKLYRRWQETYPEANKYILCNRYISTRSRFVQWCAWKKQFWIVRLYCQLIHRLIYGIIYR